MPKGDKVTFDDSAPLAAIRRSITAYSVTFAKQRESLNSLWPR